MNQIVVIFVPYREKFARAESQRPRAKSKDEHDQTNSPATLKPVREAEQLPSPEMVYL